MRSKIPYALFFCLFSASTFADYSLLIDGVSKHFGCKKNRHNPCEYNEINPGLGIELSSKTSNWGIPFIRAGAYKDSYSDAAAYAAMGVRQDWEISGPFRFGAGVMGGYLKSKRQDGAIALPFIYLTYKDLALELGYIADTQILNQRNKAKSLATLGFRWDF
ncbi:hypothetical protein [Iodobacter fluviatilis]|jgi:hypothetical protein|uniref:Outer membrane protein beta-barrel domain-containing protein n=1 Tax=Iodobacter fluviatilis TaxID=537 RepID=A0A7G3G949_9NEIS|nr:hypothetical protein [Iodobacter fluviatilis]QBC43662.1 hypothetical protein C1H71_08970 [Iodobacter fluviatilis]